MAKRYKKPAYELPHNTIITVVAKKGKEIQVKDMEYGEALKLLTKKNKYAYSFYQQGYCAIKPTK